VVITVNLTNAHTLPLPALALRCADVFVVAGRAIFCINRFALASIRLTNSLGTFVVLRCVAHDYRPFIKHALSTHADQVAIAQIVVIKSFTVLVACANTVGVSLSDAFSILALVVICALVVVIAWCSIARKFSNALPFFLVAMAQDTRWICKRDAIFVTCAPRRYCCILPPY
jgi:hypothetical protein